MQAGLITTLPVVSVTPSSSALSVRRVMRRVSLLSNVLTAQG